MEKEPKKYEISFLVRNEDESEEISKILQKHKATILENGGISRIKLAYPIKKENFACFGYFNFSADSGEISKINGVLKLNPKVLRFLFITPPIAKSIPQPIARKAAPFKPIAPKPEAKKEPQAVLTNEALEKKLEEILK
ncbi:30S ribosomal protein S6 [Candidatus Wolfebacteria bacterium RIFCSPLOWO2_01_FULL_38_11]|uniref:Small ribosomal subunit protein bS6 n=2 Tax=Candidatus Wolfeibacteriota TaxID=1752735 RepID=A0A0G0GAF8_9BACT|nr:MAG: hypothetical protein US36_C0005G0016 [Candidatus Wolfebacteria bacterium GW2011_GWC1_37_10]OGM90678.1 MAG: 30S ribosomal protein S6 [Candidatus Wolfebacteria bacterium RIFCSPLOWO2_01_FULL_38_11]